MFFFHWTLAILLACFCGNICHCMPLNETFLSDGRILNVNSSQVNSLNISTTEYSNKAFDLSGGRELNVNSSQVTSPSTSTTEEFREKLKFLEILDDQNVFEAGKGNMRICTMFGCDCEPPSNARCCDGYGYDPRVKKCRIIDNEL